MIPHTMFIVFSVVLLWAFVCGLVTGIAALTTPSGWVFFRPVHPYAHSPRNAFEYWQQWFLAPAMWLYALGWLIFFVVRMSGNTEEQMEE